MAIFRVDRFTTPGPRCFTMPAGFYPDVEIHAWGAGGGKGYGAFMSGAPGGGGGYSTTTVNMAEGDIIELCVGSAGGQSSSELGGLGGLSYIGTRFAGGHGGPLGTHFPGGGGGGASAVYVNSPTGITQTLVLVAAGGGGGSNVRANGERRPGMVGGVFSDLLSVLSGERGDTIGGGGSGGGRYGGKSVPHYGGSGGSNFALASVTATPSMLQAGSGLLVGGKSTSYYPASYVGDAGYDGAIVLVLRRKMQIFNKNTSTWNRISRISTRIPSNIKPISKVFAPKTITFSSLNSTIFTVPPRVTSIVVAMCGGSGGAGGGDVGGDKNNTGGGGGGASNIVASTLTVLPGSTYNITAGAGGIGGGPGGTGGTGGTTTITTSAGGAVLSAAGATGGTRGGNDGHGTGGIGANGGGNGISIAGGLSTNGGTPGGTGVAKYYSTGGPGVAGFARITYTVPPEFILTELGGWKSILDVFRKENGKWIPVNTTNTVPYKIEEIQISPGTRTWTCPADVTKIKVKVYGGGAGGALGGGGAGGIATAFYTVVPGQTYSYTVGAGGALNVAGGASNFGTVIANGGAVSIGGAAGAGGTTSISGAGSAITAATSNGKNGGVGIIVYYWYGWNYWGYGYNNFSGIGGYAYNSYLW